MSRSPRIRAINVSQTGLRIRSPMICCSQILELVDHDEEGQPGNRQLRDIVNATKTMIVLLRGCRQSARVRKER